MSEYAFRRILWTVLLLIAPTVVFLVQVVFVVPTVFVPAGLVYMAYKLVRFGWDSEMLVFIGFFLVHLAVFGGLYWLVAWLAGKLCCLFSRGLWRLVPLALLLTGLAAATQLPVYGGGGHGPAKFGPLQFIVGELEREYGQGAVGAVYVAALLVCGLAYGAVARYRRRTSHQAADAGNDSDGMEV